MMVDSAVMKACPVIEARYPGVSPIIVVAKAVPVNLPPVTLSCVKVSPTFITPCCISVATLAVVPVPHGERSTMPGSMITMIRASAASDWLSPKK